MFDTSYIETHNESGVYQGIEVNVINGETQTCDKLELVRQKVRNALSFWYGEWFLNVDYGVDYESIFSDYQDNNIIAEITNTILNVTGVEQIQSLSTQLIDNKILFIKVVIIAYNEQITMQLESG